MLTRVTPIEHFRSLVAEAVSSQRVKTNDLAVCYISALLESYILSERVSKEPLAITYLKAMHVGKETRVRMLKGLGDLTLFTSGFFSDSLKRKVVDIDYYIAIGAASYSYVARLHDEEQSGGVSSLFLELASKFSVFVDVLAEVSERSRLTSERDILRVYERWLKTKSRQAERLLRDYGIDPLDAGRRRIH